MPSIPSRHSGGGWEVEKQIDSSHNLYVIDSQTPPGAVRDRDSVPDSDRDPEAETAAELDVDPVVSLVSYLAFDPVDPVVEPVP